MTAAVFIENRDEFAARNVPGSFWVSPADSDGERRFWYRCPCGCGRRAPLTVGENFKPADSPS